MRRCALNTVPGAQWVLVKFLLALGRGEGQEMGNIAKGRKMKLWVGRIAGHFVNINNIANSEQWSPDLGLGRQGVQ